MFRWFKKHTKDGLEVPDPTPIEVTMRTKPLTIAEQLQRFVENDDLKARYKNNGIDTFDEANDFDMPDMDDDERRTPYEDQFYGTEMPFNGLQARLDEQKAGMTEEIPIDRLERAKERLRSKPTAQPAAVAASEIKAKLDA